MDPLNDLVLVNRDSRTESRHGLKVDSRLPTFDFQSVSRADPSSGLKVEKGYDRIVIWLIGDVIRSEDSIRSEMRPIGT